MIIYRSESGGVHRLVTRKAVQRARAQIRQTGRGTITQDAPVPWKPGRWARLDVTAGDRRHWYWVDEAVAVDGQALERAVQRAISYLGDGNQANGRNGLSSPAGWRSDPLLRRSRAAHLRRRNGERPEAASSPQAGPAHGGEGDDGSHGPEADEVPARQPGRVRITQGLSSALWPPRLPKGRR